MYEISRRIEFDAGHRVPLHESKCKTPHGHRYVAEICCSADQLTPEGFVVDFGIVKETVGAWIDEFLDHTMIYQRGDFLMERYAELAMEEGAGLRRFFEMPKPPTAENLAELIFSAARLLLEPHHVHVLFVVVHETPNCKARWPGGSPH